MTIHDTDMYLLHIAYLLSLCSMFIHKPVPNHLDCLAAATLFSLVPLSRYANVKASIRYSIKCMIVIIDEKAHFMPDDQLLHEDIIHPILQGKFRIVLPFITLNNASSIGIDCTFECW